ncbi:MAG: cytochrome ubiquinol oxidase subunit I [Sporomusaceae bacterium]|nr:cytochrome ubiquinol oxidase subunit I [Sporomusaceae bacterium]
MELILARWQFAVTSTYHWLFVPVTLGMTILIAIMETMYVRTGNEMYKKMTKFWGKLFLINFAMGVVTGIVQEFHFGMNWSEYSRFMGDIFGAPLALEALTAFFLESVFVGVWIFGWERFSPKAHAATAWCVAIGSNLSAFWILVANSFMQHPVGYVVRNGRAELNDFGAVVTNPYVVHQFPHVVLAGIATAGSLVMAISAWHLLRKNQVEFFTKSMKVGVTAALLGMVLTAGAGHASGQYLAEAQPMKLAALEALWHTEQSAPFSLVSSINEEKQQNDMEVSVPGMLSFLVYNSTQGEVKGLKDLQAEYTAKYGPGDYIPAVVPTFWAFRAMVGVGSLMILLAAWGAYLVYTQKIAEATTALKILFWTLPLTYIANATGWFVAEAGRQPWIVVGLQKTAEGVSTAVPAGSIMISLIGFTLIYGLLAAVALRLFIKFIKLGPDSKPAVTVKTNKGATLWN